MPEREPGGRGGGLAPLIADRRGSTATEYALVASIVAISAIGGLVALGRETLALYAGLGVIAAAIRGVLGE